MSLDETLLRHAEDLGNFAPSDVLLARPDDELVPASRQGRLLVSQGAKFVSGAHLSSVTDLTHETKCSKLSFMSDKLTYVNRAASGLSHAVVPGTLTTACGRSVYEDESPSDSPLLTRCEDCDATIKRVRG